MKRAAVALVFALAWLAVPFASAATHQVTIRNYTFEDDAQHDQTKITVRQGDQITFTVRQAAYPSHTVDVDALDIHSPDLNIGQTFTTPALTKPGNFYLYCRPHEARGHHTRLIVVATASKTAAPTPRRTATPRPAATATPAAGVTPSASASASPSPSPTPPSSPAATLAPVGVGTAPPGTLTDLTPDPGSLEALTGVRRSNEIPWTRAVRWLLIATVPIVGAAVFALRRDATLHAAAVRAAAEAEAAAAATARRRKPPTKGKRKR